MKCVYVQDSKCHGTKTRLAVSQPLRAESGKGSFTFPTGRTKGGERLYRTERFELAPDARELRFTLRQDRDLPGGRLAVEAGLAVDAGHVAGREQAFAGLGYRLEW